ncbi:hypothetical protein [Nannocystis punicea]|uniref:UDP-N-acetyl-alpha-D-muramoyl-L-alanyl-L-glutamate epimerase n=1 Tax=Nannocystis punicea TaxID=2995304 RepID=A0ABY7H714_9BACT|nr:hypothetical protein [Nannocystis poenicansa]WAS94779.1 hypothetical protein O0S08_01350 [Nannocystis poenicansa]
MPDDLRHTAGGRVLRLRGLDFARHSVRFAFAVDGLTFSTTYWYEDVDFDALAAAHSREALQRLMFHVAALEAAKLCSLRPQRLCFGAWARFWTRELAALWRALFREVWAQWRYENDDPGYLGPEVLADEADAGEPLRPAVAPPVETLLFCGGGKDSLVAMRLLERAGVAFDTLGYSSSIYGPAALQHGLLDGLVRRCRPRRHFHQWILEDFLDSPVLRLHPELAIRTLCAAETPTSIFAALPIALQHGHPAISLAHERSADRGQLVWDRTGEEINHQWGKSAAAEALLNDYLQRHLLAGVAYHSVLKPIYDPVIFAMLRPDADDVAFTHSCNLRKPWCLRCPKCLYVWLGCAAFLPREVVRRTFGDDALLADPTLAPAFLALRARGGRQPFECIGGPEEATLFLAACAARKLRGPATADLPDAAALLRLVERYAEVDLAGSTMPPALGERVAPELLAGARAARVYLRGVLRGATEA